MANNNNNNDDFDDFDDEGFEDFDQSGGSTLGDLWRNNPVIKIAAVVVLGVIVIGGIFLIGGGGGSEDAPSRVAQAPQEREVPGSDELPEQYREQLRQQNEERAVSAMRSGDRSQVPVPIFEDQARVLDQLDQQEVEEEEDPFAIWRMEELRREVEQQQVQQQQQQEDFVRQFDDAVQMQPDPQSVSQLSQAMIAQMQQILGSQQIAPTSLITVTTEPEPAQIGIGQNGQAGGDNSGIQTSSPIDTAASNVINEKDVLIPAGTVLYAQLLTEANSDVPGPVLGQILDGEFLGARLIGSFERNYRYLTINFSRMTVGRKSYSVQGVALNPNTSIGGLQTEYDSRYFSRVVLPAAARFIEGVGSAIAESESTTVSINGTTVATEQEDVDFGQELARGVEEGAREFGDILDDQANEIEPLIRVAAGTPMAIFFTQDVLKDGRNPAALMGQTGLPAESNIRTQLPLGGLDLPNLPRELR